VGAGSAEPSEIRVKAMEAVQSLDCSREGLPGVWGAERIEGGGGNWGGPPRPSPARWPADFLAAGAWRPITGDPGKWSAGLVGVGGGRSTG
jgi:hypothetical protein